MIDVGWESHQHVYIGLMESNLFSNPTNLLNMEVEAYQSFSHKVHTHETVKTQSVHLYRKSKHLTDEFWVIYMDTTVNEIYKRCN